MILAIVFAALWGVLQLTVLGSLARTVRVRTVLMAIAVGLYACVPLAVLLQLAWTWSWAWLTDSSHYLFIYTAGQTVDPFIEEILKVLPVAVLLTIPAIRRQWSMTDCVLLGAACGAGFGLGEDLFRYAQRAQEAQWNPGGWSFFGIFASPTVPSPWTTVTSWLAPGVLQDDLLMLSGKDYPPVNLHLAWSAVGGLAVALILLRRDTISRIAGVLLLLYVAVDHAAFNADVTRNSSLMRNLLAFMPIVALGIAWWFDRRSQRSGDRVEPVLPAERDASPRLVGTLRAAVSRVPWSVPWVYGLVRLRRAHNAAAASEYGDDERRALGAALVAARNRVQRDLVQPESPGWVPNGWTRSGLLAALRRPTVILWLVLMTPSFLWFVVGGWPQTAAVQQMLTGPVAWKVVVALSVVSQVWLARMMIQALRAWPQARRFPLGEDAAMAGLRIAQGVGTVAFGGYCLLRVGAGHSPDERLFYFHALEAFNVTSIVFGALFGGMGTFIAGGVHAGYGAGVVGGVAALEWGGDGPPLPDTDKVGHGESPAKRDSREKAESELKVEADEAEARLLSAASDLEAAHAAKRLAGDKATKLAETADDGRASGNYNSEVETAFSRAAEDSNRANGTYARALKAYESAKSDANAANRAYESVLTGRRQAADDDWGQKK